MSTAAARLRPAHVLAAAEALHTILTTARAGDVVLQELFQKRSNMGSRDRAHVGDLVYGALRGYFPALSALGWKANALELCVAALLIDRNLSAEGLPPLRELDYDALARRLAAAPPPSPAARLNLPEWLHSTLLAEYREAETEALARALNQPGTVDLRVNTLKGTREDAIEKLRQEGIAAEPLPGTAAALRLARRVPLHTTAAFREGLVEPQDEGSQRLAEFVHAAPGETVVDFCAGAGGKTLALGAQMQNQGTVWAFDVSRPRLARLEPRLARSGLSIVRRQVLEGEDDATLAPLAGRCDAVLVDAPCSGTGTWRRNPELRLRVQDLPALQARQRSILRSAAALVRPGGRLVYATCSVLRDENEAVVDALRETHPDFSREAELRLLPHRDGTDGFYAVRLVKAAN